MSPDGRLVAVTDGGLVLVRTADHALLRLALEDAAGRPLLAPNAAAVGAFLGEPPKGN